MDAEMIRAIGGLWLLALVLSLTVLTIILRKELRLLVEKGITRIQLKRGDTELSISRETAGKEEEPMPAPDEEAVTAESQIAPEPAEPETPQEWHSTMVKAFLSGDMEKGDAAFEAVQDSDADPVEKMRCEVVYLYFRYMHASDTAALGKLEDLAALDDVSAWAYSWLGACYAHAGDFEKAASAYECSAEKSQEDKERAGRVVSSAGYLYRAGRREDAFSRIAREIEKAEAPDVMSMLYEGLAHLYELAEEPQLRALTLEKALEIKPNDPGLRFGAAYSHSHSDSDSLAILHYRTLLEFDPENAATLNNLGVGYESLAMPMLSVHSYRRAFELHNTLAGANLAYRFMNSGFATEASQILDEAKQQPDLHPNVGSAIAALSDREEEESKILERTLASAHEQRRFLLSFGTAYFAGTGKPGGFCGTWQFVGSDIEVTISQDNDTINADWVQDKVNHRFRGQLRNRGAMITMLRMGTGWSPDAEPRFTEDGRGYAFLSPDGQEISIMIRKDDAPLFRTLKKT